MHADNSLPPNGPDGPKNPHDSSYDHDPCSINRILAKLEAGERLSFSEMAIVLRQIGRITGRDPLELFQEALNRNAAMREFERAAAAAWERWTPERWTPAAVDSTRKALLVAATVAADLLDGNVDRFDLETVRRTAEILYRMPVARADLQHIDRIRRALALILTGHRRNHFRRAKLRATQRRLLELAAAE